MDDAAKKVDAQAEIRRVTHERQTQTYQARQDMVTQVETSLRTDNQVQTDVEDIAASTGSGRPPPPEPGAGGVLAGQGRMPQSKSPPNPFGLKSWRVRST